MLSGDHIKEASDLGMPWWELASFTARVILHSASPKMAGRDRGFTFDFDKAPVVPLFEADGKPSQFRSD